MIHDTIYSYQARAERGLLTNEEDTIPVPSDSIGAPKIYIKKKRILGTQILMLGFFLLYEIKKITRRNFLMFAFFTALPKLVGFGKRRRRKKCCLGRCQQPIC